MWKHVVRPNLKLVNFWFHYPCHNIDDVNHEIHIVMNGLGFKFLKPSLDVTHLYQMRTIFNLRVLKTGIVHYKLRIPQERVYTYFNYLFDMPEHLKR